LFPAIGLIFGIIGSVISLVWSIGLATDLLSRYQGVLDFDLLSDIGLTAFLVYAVVQFFGKKRNTPKVMIAWMIARLVVYGLLIPINADAEPFEVSKIGWGIIGSIIWLLWIPYFLVSKRVKRTFVIP
jgi:hypothetical protein